MTQKFVDSIFSCSLFANSQQKILLSRWLHSKLVSTLRFVSNWKTMFWIILQEQHSIKSLEFTKNNNYFYSFIYEKNIWQFISQESCGFNTKILSACWRYKPGFCFSPCIRYKWVKRINWSTKLSLTRQGLT